MEFYYRFVVSGFRNDGLNRTMIVCHDMQSGKMSSMPDFPFDEVEIAKRETSEGIMRLPDAEDKSSYPEPRTALSG